MPHDLCVGDIDPAGELVHGYLGGVVELFFQKRARQGYAGEGDISGDRDKRTSTR